jgi:hypothetical protein
MRVARLTLPSERPEGIQMTEESRDADADVIAIRLDSIAQLFHSLDPLPFREKDLDKDAADYIVSWARELPRDRPFRIAVYLPEAQLALPEAKDIGPAVRQFFAYRAQESGLELKELFRVGRRSLAIGMTVLLLAVIARQTVAARFEPGPLVTIVEESLLIFAWVANWRPIEIFLYDWWPIVRRRKLSERLAAAEVELRPYGPGQQRERLLPMG